MSFSLSSSFYDRYHSADGLSQADVDAEKKWEQFINDFDEHAIDYECSKVGVSDEPCELYFWKTDEMDYYPESVKCHCKIHKGTVFVNNPFYES